MRDIWFAEQMLKELQKNYEDLIDPITGESRPDTNTLRDWSKLFASTTPDGQITRTGQQYQRSRSLHPVASTRKSEY